MTPASGVSPATAPAAVSPARSGYRFAYLLAALVALIVVYPFASNDRHQSVLFSGVLVVREVTTDTLYGAIAGYLMLGVTWGLAYALIEQLQPGSFRSMLAPNGHVAWPEFTFLSFERGESRAPRDERR